MGLRVNQDATRTLTVVLAAGRPASGNRPASTSRVDASGRVLDWIRSAVDETLGGEMVIVAGFGLEEVAAAYPDLTMIANSRWQRTGAVGSLLCAPLHEADTVISCYGDVVLRPTLLAALRDAPGDAVIVVDPHWERRYEERRADRASAEKVAHRDGRLLAAGAHLGDDAVTGEFTGLLRLSGAALAHLLARRGTAERWGLPVLLQDLVAAGLPVAVVESTEWAEIDAPGDLARFILGSKAQTLARLRGVVRRSVVDRQADFTRAEWLHDRASTISRLQALFGERLVAVRSSAATEDGWEASHAGQFRSILAVPAADEARLATAIDEVAASYPDDAGGHELLVQEFVTEPALSGVVATRVLGTGAPYRVASYTSGGTTDTATGAGTAELRTAFMRRTANATDLDAAGLDDLAPVLSAVQEVERLLGYDRLDVEFAQTPDGLVHIFQVRPVVTPDAALPVEDTDVEAALTEARALFDRLQTPGPGVVGERAIFGAMPDWNPAEIVGLRPSRLAASLYAHVITDETWARQRAQVGYRNVTGEPLLASFGGHPYVDVRLSFNSFVPAALPDALAARIVDRYVARLAAHPELHDRVEFEVALTCLVPDFDARAARLLGDALTPAEVDLLRGALHGVTRAAIDRSESDRRTAEALDRPATVAGSLADVRRLLQEARAGALPFAHLARQAFIATAILEGVRAEGGLDAAVEAFLGSIATVPARMAEDGAHVASGALPWEAFVARYGHLRPGTYGLSTPRYDADPARYLEPFVRASRGTTKPPYTFRGDARTRLQAALDRTGLGLDVATFEVFARRAIEGREYAKFVFTRPLSEALEAIAAWGQTLGFTREDLMHLSVADLFSVERGEVTLAVAEFVARRVAEGRHAAEISACVELPLLLTEARDFVVFERQVAVPNFVTSKRVVAPAMMVGRAAADAVIDGCVLLLPNADPGYDWIFAHPIAGFVTMFGGVNSHMAVRAHEFGIPAAIGVGETRYEALLRAPVIALDCGAQRIQPLGHLS